MEGQRKLSLFGIPALAELLTSAMAQARLPLRMTRARNQEGSGQRTIFSRAYYQDRSKYKPHQGKRECEWRMRQTWNA